MTDQMTPADRLRAAARVLRHHGLGHRVNWLRVAAYIGGIALLGSLISVVWAQDSWRWAVTAVLLLFTTAMLSTSADKLDGKRQRQAVLSATSGDPALCGRKVDDWNQLGMTRSCVCVLPVHEDGQHCFVAIEAGETDG